MQKQTKAENYLKKQINNFTLTLYSCFILTLMIATNIKMSFKVAIYLTLFLTISTLISFKFINKYIAKSKFKNQYQYKYEDMDNEKVELVKRVSSKFNHLIKNKKMNRTDIITVKELINQDIDTRIYKNANFKNDAHEIYTKLKDRQLSKNQLIVIESYLNLCEN